jgi:hypothetical protein
MNRISKKTGTELTRQGVLWSRMYRGAFTMLAVAGLMFAVASANAACGILTGLGSKTPMKMPMLAQAENAQGSGYSDSIVGLWHVIYTTSGGALFGNTFDTWHSDGTEFENTFLPPEVGNICYGVWKQTGRTIRLHHIGWTFTPGPMPGTATGTFTLDEINSVSFDGKSYSGSFTFQAYDINGVAQGGPVTGSIAATRITVQ